ncbi:MAG: alpha/beta hydrolase [Candidatus Zixiibacteriota bacterium]|nr:MAG: alpha/beta hydrolase [candidate division Zixibacteria bacterium]
MKKVLTVFVTAAIFAALTGCGQDKVAQGPFVGVDSVAATDGVMIQYEVQGAGEKALVLVHCWSCDRSYWSTQVEALKEDYRVVTLDLPGHGESGANRQQWTLQQYGEDVATVVNKLRLEEVILVGHSMGGTVIIEAARVLGDRVVALVGVDTYQRFDSGSTPEEIEAFVAPFREDFPERTAEMVRNIFGVGADSALVEWVVVDMSDTDPEVAVALFEELFGYDAVAALAEMRKPVWAINGDKWPVDVENNRKVAETFEVIIIPSTGHFPHMEEPEAFNAELVKVLGQIWPVGTPEG